MPIMKEPATEYVAGTVVKVTATFINGATGAKVDPGSGVTATAQYGYNQISPPVTLSVTHDSTGVYHVDVPTDGWTGPGLQPVFVTFTGTGTNAGVIYDGFVVTTKGDTIADVTGP